MTRRKNGAIQTLTGAETAFVADALRRGATRRELMGWFAAAGMTALTAGAVVTTTTQALAQTVSQVLRALPPTRSIPPKDPTRRIIPATRPSTTVSRYSTSAWRRSSISRSRSKTTRRRCGRSSCARTSASTMESRSHRPMSSIRSRGTRIRPSAPRHAPWSSRSSRSRRPALMRSNSAWPRRTPICPSCSAYRIS